MGWVGAVGFGARRHFGFDDAVGYRHLERLATKLAEDFQLAAVNGSANNLKEFYHEIVTADLRGDLFNQQRSMEGGISCQSADCTIGPEAYTIAHEYLLIDVVSIQLFIIQALVSIKFAEQN